MRLPKVGKAMNKFMDAAIKKITETVGIFEPDEEFYYHLNMFVIKNIVPKLRDRRLRMLDCRAGKNLCVRCVREHPKRFSMPPRSKR